MICEQEGRCSILELGVVWIVGEFGWGDGVVEWATRAPAPTGVK